MTTRKHSLIRTTQLALGGLLVSGVCAVVVASAATVASAAACQGCVLVSAPTIGLNVTAEPGEQAVIDKQGGVAVYTPLTTASIGGPGTVWMVGHRTTHGSVFNRVPTLVAGDPIDLVDDAGTHRYIVSRLMIVSESGWASEVDINDTSRSRLILQTSHPDSQLRYLVEAFVTDASATAAVPVAVPVAAPAVAPTVVPATTPAVATPPPPPARTGKFGSIKSDV